jgi:hypothetical protein
MAVNVDSVYKTVLLILNKEQRGYITPEEFNKIGSQVQQEVFETYFEDLNQQLRVPQTDAEYANRQKNVDNKIAIFKTFGNCTYPGPYFQPPTNVHRIGTVIYKDEIEVERIQKNDLLYLNLSTLTKPTTTFPVYLYENSTAGITGSDTSVPHIYVYPKTITGAGIISCSYIRKPNDIVWGYKGLPTTPNAGVPWTTGPYIYDSTTSVQFELDPTEKTNIIIRILGYAGVIIRDPEIVQAASQKAQSEEVNSKS